MCVCGSSDGARLWAQLLAIDNLLNWGEAVPLPALSPCSPLNYFHCQLKLG